MTASPFSNVLAASASDTTSATASRPDDTPTEPSVGVEGQTPDKTHVSGQDETPGDATSGS